MTMDLKVKDKTALGRLKAGQQVEFTLAREPDGGYVITRIASQAK